MNILIPDSWLREYLDTKATPNQIKDCLSLCGPSVERLQKLADDWIYEIEITTNRIDTVSVYGIAREAAAILPRFGLNASLKSLPLASNVSLQNNLPFSVSDPQILCNRILAVVMDQVSLGKSPPLIRDRLEKSGVRSLNNAVDVTNYVMLEAGHPCHVFDYDRIKTHEFLIRCAKHNEPIVTLDGKRYLLSTNDVIIDDGTGRVIDLPGIMGTQNSVVNKDTKRIILFIESNDPLRIRKSSLHFGIRTMAAAINEKHPDPELAKTALLRGIKLMEELTGAKPASQIIDLYPKKPAIVSILVSVPYINDRLGVVLSEEEISKILTSLDFQVSKQAPDILKIQPPTFRQFDVTGKQDVVEEVARLYGYHRLPAKLMTGQIPLTQKPKEFIVEQKVKTMCKFWGYTEVYNYSFCAKRLLELAKLDPQIHLKVANPLTSDTAFLRTSLIPSLLTNAQENQHRKTNLHFFELASVYMPQKDSLPLEKSMLSFIASDNFYRLKGIVSAILRECGIIVEEKSFKSSTFPFIHPKQSVVLVHESTTIAYIGVVNPRYKESFGINNTFSVADIDFEAVVNLYNPIKHYNPVSSYNQVVEDITLSIPSRLSFQKISKTISDTSKLVSEINHKDSFKDRITLQISYRHLDRNLTNEQVSQVRNQIQLRLTKIGVILH